MVTWQTFIKQLPSQNLQSLATRVRDSYGTYGVPLTFNQFLSLDSGNAASTGFDAATLGELWVELLLANDSKEAKDYPQYIALFAQPEQPLAAAFAAALQQAGISFENFQSGEAREQATRLLEAGHPSYWAATVQSLQQRGQVLLDTEGRLEAFIKAQGREWQEPSEQLLKRLTERQPFTSLYSIARASINRLALAISPVDESTSYFNLVLQQAIDLAKQVVDENYPPDVAVNTFLSGSPVGREGGQALLRAMTESTEEPVSALARASVEQVSLRTEAESTEKAVTVLARASVEQVIAKLKGRLEPNSALVYGLAQLLQNRVIQFLNGTGTATSEALVPVTFFRVEGQLTGATGKPLANVGLRLTQQLTLRPSIVLGELFTSPDGHFPARLHREYTVDSEDVISPLPSILEVEVFAPGKLFSEEPVLRKSYDLSPDKPVMVVETELSEGLPLLESRPVGQVLPAPLLPELQQYLKSIKAESLADIRQMGGLLNRPDVSQTGEAAQIAMRQLDGLARFEVISSDTALHYDLVQQNFFSPQQLLTQTSREELVQQLASADDPRWQDPQLLDERRRQVAVFYEQTAAVDALTRTVGLFAAVEKANGSGNVPVLLLPQNPDQEQAPPTEEIHDDTSGYLRGQLPLETYNPAPNGMVTTYQSAQQCDCAACRSAVGPTAYLAALLQYAETNLRTANPADAVTPRFLQNALLQPFNDLTLSCQYAEEKVCKYRLAIEVIQAFWRTRTVPGRTLTFADGQPYVRAILEALLQSLGTSTQEVLAATSDTARTALENRLRLPATALASLGQRFGSSALVAGRSLDAIEDDLEQVFGLASTARDPLSTGGRLAGSTPTASAVQLIRWNFQGVQWDLNAGLDGLLHLEVLVDNAPTK